MMKRQSLACLLLFFASSLPPLFCHPLSRVEFKFTPGHAFIAKVAPRKGKTCSSLHIRFSIIIFILECLRMFPGISTSRRTWETIGIYERSGSRASRFPRAIYITRGNKLTDSWQHPPSLSTSTSRHRSPRGFREREFAPSTRRSSRSRSHYRVLDKMHDGFLPCARYPRAHLANHRGGGFILRSR